MTYKALVLEDNVEFQTIISTFLREILSFQVDVCATYTEAITLISRANPPYDIVMTDIDLDGQPYGTMIVEHLLNHGRGELCVIISGTLLDVSQHFTIAEARSKGILVNALVKNPRLTMELHRILPEALKKRNEKQKPLHIFISYRRDDSADVTGRIYDRLVEIFQKENIFRDIDSIPTGMDFRDYIRESVHGCDVLVAIIGKDWLNITNERGKRRLDDEGDFVRNEISAALQRDIPVIPILVQNAMMPKEDDLPDVLRDLAYRHGRAVRRDPDFHEDVNRLITDIEKYRLK
jgi:CheY-like chemotaxis protein